MKRLTLWLCFVILCIGLFVCGASAQTDDAELEEIYAEIREAILAGEDEVDLHHYQIPRNEIGEILQAFRWENPDISFCLTEGVEYSYSREDNTIIDLMLEYDDKTTVQARYEWLNAEADAILSCVDADWSEVQKLLWINDYICDRFRYEITTEHRTAYEMLQTGEGVCEAYTSLFNLLAKRCGIAVSYSYSDELVHVWSMVRLEGEWYHVDVTWNDNRVSMYRYFLLSEAENRIAHSDTFFEAYARYSATDTRYDSAFWRNDCNSSFVFVEGDTYCIYDGKLSMVDLDTLQTQAIYTLPDASWRVPNQPSFYVKKFYDLAAIGDLLIYNLPNEIYGYSLSSERVVLLHTSTEQTEIYCIGAAGQMLRTGFCQQLEYDVTYHRELALDGVHLVRYYLDGELYTVRTYCGGWPLVLPEAPTRQHYTFLGWSADAGLPASLFTEVTGSYLMDESVSEITFVSDGVVYDRIWIEKGSVIPLPTDPQKSADVYYHYDFLGWDGYLPGMTATDEYMVFNADYTRTKRTYTVTYLVDGEVFFEHEVEAGSHLTYIDLVPNKAPIQRFRYQFTGWVGASNGKEITKDLTLEATFARIDVQDTEDPTVSPPRGLVRDVLVLLACAGIGLPMLVLLITLLIRSRRRY